MPRLYVAYTGFGAEPNKGWGAGWVVLGADPPRNAVEIEGIIAAIKRYNDGRYADVVPTFWAPLSPDDPAGLRTDA